MDDVEDKLQEHVNKAEIEAQLKKQITAHQEKSREGASQKFKGGLASHEDQIIKYHTATHLLHWALREVLGTDTRQMGSNITNERLRFDFTTKKEPTPEDYRKVDELINAKITEGINVAFVEMAKEDAIKLGALHFFGEKYGEMVKVYFIGDTLDKALSKEFCGGPHVNNTKEIGNVEIFKTKSTGIGNYRVYMKHAN
jgi:alanyl-tRNA synthetase